MQPRPSSLAELCVECDMGELDPASNACFNSEHTHSPNPQWWITEDGYPFSKGNRVYNYYDGVWGTVESDPEGPFGWFDFRPDGKGYTTSLNSVRISKFKPSR